MKRKKEYISPVLNHNLAIVLSLNFSLLLVFFVFIGFIFREKEVTNSINQETVINFIIHFFTGVFTVFLFFEYCFWVFRKIFIGQ